MRRSKESMKRELRIYYKNLDILKVQKANYGIKVPLELANKIEHIKKEITDLEAELEKFNKTQPRKESMKRELRIYYKDLDILKVQKAICGIDVPLELANKIEHIKKEITDLEAELEKFNKTQPRIAKLE